MNLKEIEKIDIVHFHWFLFIFIIISGGPLILLMILIMIKDLGFGQILILSLTFYIPLMFFGFEYYRIKESRWALGKIYDGLKDRVSIRKEYGYRNYLVTDKCKIKFDPYSEGQYSIGRNSLLLIFEPIPCKNNTIYKKELYRKGVSWRSRNCFWGSEVNQLLTDMCKLYSQKGMNIEWISGKDERILVRLKLGDFTEYDLLELIEDLDTVLGICFLTEAFEPEIIYS